MKTINVTVLANEMVKLANSKPGFELANYSDMASYKSDYNHYKKAADFNRSFTVNKLEYLLDKLSINQIDYAFSRYSGRLSYDKNTMKLDYCTGQYYCTEYQQALKMVITSIVEQIQ